MRGNTVSIKGGITRDAEIRRTKTGSIVASWSIATNKSRKTDHGYEEIPQYFDVQAWLTEKQLEYLEPQLVKGARCAVIDGHLEYSEWQVDGRKCSKVLIQVDDPVSGLMLSAKQQKKQEKRQEPENVYDEGYADSDIPF